MSKIRGTIEEFTPDPRLVDERGPTRERLRGVDFHIGQSGGVTVRQSPVERALKRGTLNEQQGRAAEKLYLHWYRASMAGSIGSSDPLKVFGSGTSFSNLCATEASEFHWNRLTAGIKIVKQSMDGAGQSGDDAVKLLEYVVCREIPFEEAGQKIGFSGKNVAQINAISGVRAALNILAREWGL